MNKLITERLLHNDIKELRVTKKSLLFGLIILFSTACFIVFSPKIAFGQSIGDYWLVNAKNNNMNKPDIETGGELSILGVRNYAEFGILPNENIASASSLKVATSISSQVTTGPDNKAWIAYIGKDRNVWLITLDGSQQVQVTSDASGIQIQYSNLKWSPDGKLLAFIRSDFISQPSVRNIYIYDIDINKMVSVVDDALLGFNWSPDGEEIIYSKCSGDDILVSNRCTGLWIYKIADKENIILLRPPSNTYLDRPGWSPKGTYLGFDLNIPAAMAEKSQFQIANKNQPEAYLPLASIEPQTGNNCTWAPSEDKLACNNSFSISDNCQINIIDLSGNILNEYSIAARECQTEPLWSPDGEYIATAIGGSNGGVNLLKLNNSAQIYLMKGKPENWSSDSTKLLVNYSGKIVIYDLISGLQTPISDGWGAVWQPGIITPKPIIDLDMEPVSDPFGTHAIKLKWSVPEIDNEISAYDIRYSADPITEGNWENASVISPTVTTDGTNAWTSDWGLTHLSVYLSRCQSIFSGGRLVTPLEHYPFQ